MGQLYYRKKYKKVEKDSSKKPSSHSRLLERIVKGFANHRRIEILLLLKKTPELSVEEIGERLSVNIKTISEHLQRLTIAGLIMKRNAGRSVRHKLTARGNVVLTFLRMLE